MKVGGLIKGLDMISFTGPKDVDITGVSYDSREVSPGDVFVCIKGEKYDGHDFVPDAVARGACAILASQDVEVPPGVSVLIARDTRRMMGWLAKRVYGDPSSCLWLVGVTGTKGKTTTTYLVKSIFEAAGRPTGLIGTIQYMIGNEAHPAKRTTPESSDLVRFMAKMVRAEMKCAVMEVSSHAIDQGRVEGLEFNVGIFTNITRDHLDYHKTFENYLDAKARFFEGMRDEEKVSVINLDDPSGAYIRSRATSRVVTYGCSEGVDYRAINVDLWPEGASFLLSAPFGELEIGLQLTGMFNVYNALAALACGAESGVSPEDLKRGIEAVAGVPGRLERVDGGRDFAVFVDYAHTPDSLEKVLKTVAGFTRGRKIVVFGCGGDRDRGKRPMMGEIAGRLADYVIITSDNPRSEDPESICREVEAGVLKVREKGRDYHVTVDRRQAIKEAIALAHKDDVVLIAGKGHETYQIFKDRTIDFDDRKVAAEALEER